AGGGGVADGGVVVAEEFLGDVAGAGEPGGVVVVDPGAPLGAVGGVAHEECGAGEGDAEFFVGDEAAGGVEAGAPVVGAGAAPLQDGKFDLGMFGGADVGGDFFEVVFDAADA